MRKAILTVLAGCGALVGAAAPLCAKDAPKAKRQHPYLFFDKGELEALRKRYGKPPLSHYRQALVRQTDRLFERKPSKQHNRFPDSAQALLWAYHLTGREKYRDRCLEWNRANWDRKRFGQWSEMGTCALAVAYDTLYPELTDEQKAKMKAYLDRALDQHLRNEHGWLYNNPSNTVPAQCGAAGMGALALLWESPKAAEGVKLSRGKLLRYASRCFCPDGGYIEGSLYWAFGGSYYLWFAHALHNATGDDSLINHPRLLKQHRFVETVLGGDGQFMPFNDTQPWIGGWAICSDLGSRCDSDLMLWLADFMASMGAGRRDEPDIRLDSRGAYTALAVLLRSERPGPRKFPGLPTLSRLENMHWGVMRSSGEFRPNLVVGVKGSEGPLSHHKQHDLGSFVLYAGGEVLLLDPGYFQPHANCHTLPLVDGKGPKHSGSQIVSAWENERLRVMVIDSARGYGKAARRVRRTLVMVADRAVVVLDDILPGAGDAGGDGSVSWSPPPVVAARASCRVTAQYQAAQETRVDPNAGTAAVLGRKVTLGLWTFGPKLKLTVRKRDFGRSWGFNRLAKEGKLSWHSVTGDYTADANGPLVTALIPAEKGSEPPAPHYERRGQSIAVTVPGVEEVKFAKAEGRWTFVRPRGAERTK
jgi:hypothetical protein